MNYKFERVIKNSFRLEDLNLRKGEFIRKFPNSEYVIYKLKR